MTAGLREFIGDWFADYFYGLDSAGHALPPGILPNCQLIDFTRADAGDVSAAALMAATDLATRKDAPGIYQRRDGLWVMIGNPVLPGSWAGHYFAEPRRDKDRMDPALFRDLYMCEPMPEVCPAELPGERFCRDCGCSEFNACRHPEHGNCWWVKPDLCSHCANGWGNKS